METEFKINQKVVYPSQGVGVVKEVFEKKFKDTTIPYYKIYIEASDMIVMVPVEKTEELGIRQIVSAEEAEAAPAADAPAFQYGWDGSGSEGDDLYFNASVDGKTYTFVVESSLRDKDSDVYKAVKELKVGDQVDMEGFMYWYEGPQPHITLVSPVEAEE